jgi:hypothetical protein
MSSAEAGATAKEHNVVAKKRLVACSAAWLRRHFIGFLPPFVALISCRPTGAAQARHANQPTSLDDNAGTKKLDVR